MGIMTGDTGKSTFTMFGSHEFIPLLMMLDKATT
jgi:hypothetical protein